MVKRSEVLRCKSLLDNCHMVSTLYLEFAAKGINFLKKSLPVFSTVMRNWKYPGLGYFKQKGSDI